MGVLSAPYHRRSIRKDHRTFLHCSLRQFIQAQMHCKYTTIALVSQLTLFPSITSRPLSVQVRSLALHKGLFLRPREELEEAEQLRQACHDALCRTSSRSKEFPDARKQILYGYGDLNEYCKQLARPTFWGGEVEMMVITKMLKIPIHVYTPAEESGGYVLLTIPPSVADHAPA